MGCLYNFTNLTASLILLSLYLSLHSYLKGICVNKDFKSLIKVRLYCYGPSVISVTVTKGEHPRGSRLYGTSKTMGRGVAELRSQFST